MKKNRQLTVLLFFFFVPTSTRILDLFSYLFTEMAESAVETSETGLTLTQRTPRAGVRVGYKKELGLLPSFVGFTSGHWNGSSTSVAVTLNSAPGCPNSVAVTL